MSSEKQKTTLTMTQKLRVILSATVTDYAPAWTTSTLPRQCVTLDTSVMTLDRYSFLPHTEIPVFDIENEPITEPAVCQYEAARNAGSITAHFDELQRKVNSVRGFKNRVARRHQRQEAGETRCATPEAQQPPLTTPSHHNDGVPLGPDHPAANRFHEAITTTYSLLTGNRFQALADLESADTLAEQAITSFAQMRDSPWRARPTPLSKNRRKRRPKRKTYRFHQEVQPVLPSDTSTIERNGLVLYTPPRTGKTRYLAAMKQTILQVSDVVSSDREAMELLLDAGFVIATSNPAILDFDVPIIAMFPGSAPDLLTRKEGNIVCYTNVADYELVFHSQVLSHVKRYE